MKRQREHNTVSVIQKAIKYFGIPVTMESVSEALKSHPDYPTFRSICDTFREWNIDHYPLKYLPDELREVEPPYIVHFNRGGERIAFVSEIKNERVTYYDSVNKKHTIGFKEFLEKCSGAIIILDPDEKSGEKEYRKKWQEEIITRAVIPVTLLSILFFIVYTIINQFLSGNIIPDKLKVLLYFTKVTGIIFSVLLVLHEFEIHFSLTEKLCHLSKATNCSTVLNDRASKFFGWFGWADTGIIYFTGSFLYLLQSNDQLGYPLLAILAALSLPYPLYSVYYQGFVLKKWCPLCLGVQIVLIIEFIILFPVFSNLIVSFKELTHIILTFLFTGVVYCLLVMYFKEKLANKIHYNKYLGFKKNPEVLHALLCRKKHYEIPVTDHSLVFGQKDSRLRITAFLSLHCSHCAKAFEKIREILRSGAKASINIVLVTSDNKILNAIYHFNRNNMDDEALDLLGKWYSLDSFSRNKLSESLCLPELDGTPDGIGNENQELFKECNVAGTPTFLINGYQLPGQYDIDDIKYFSEAFKTIEKVKA